LDALFYDIIAARLHIFHIPLVLLGRIRDHRILRSGSASACR